MGFLAALELSCPESRWAADGGEPGCSSIALPAPPQSSAESPALSIIARGKWETYIFIFFFFPPLTEIWGSAFQALKGA